MKKINTIALLLLLISSSCKPEPKLDYKFINQENYFKCSEVDIDFFNEATYAFEDFIIKNYDFSQNGDIKLAYRNFLINARHDLIPMAERLDDYLISVIKTIKNEKNLWVASEHPKLSHTAAITTCISNSIQDDKFKNIFAALASSSTLKSSTVAPLIQADLDLAINDKSVATYIALDMFYAKLINLDYSLSKEELIKVVRDHNQSHAGHNH